MKRKAFNFYSSHWEQIKLLPKDKRIDIIEAICKVQFFEKEIEDISFQDELVNLVWVGIKHSLETSRNGFISKQLALRKSQSKDLGHPPTDGPSQGPTVQEKEKEKEQEKEQGKKEKKERYNFKEAVIGLGVQKNIVEDWLEVRKNKKATNSETAFNAIRNQIELSGVSANDAIRIAAENSWAGLKAEWIKNQQNGEKERNNQDGRKRSGKGFESDTTQQTITGLQERIIRKSNKA